MKEIYFNLNTQLNKKFIINFKKKEENKIATITAVKNPIIPTSFLTNPSLKPSKNPIVIATNIIISM